MSSSDRLKRVIAAFAMTWFGPAKWSRYGSEFSDCDNPKDLDEPSAGRLFHKQDTGLAGRGSGRFGHACFAQAPPVQIFDSVD
jgi:hypothetical protein